jgi:hypothetical protein
VFKSVFGRFDLFKSCSIRLKLPLGGNFSCAFFTFHFSFSLLFSIFAAKYNNDDDAREICRNANGQFHADADDTLLPTGGKTR